MLDSVTACRALSRFALQPIFMIHAWREAGSKAAFEQAAAAWLEEELQEESVASAAERSFLTALQSALQGSGQRISELRREAYNYLYTFVGDNVSHWQSRLGAQVLKLLTPQQQLLVPYSARGSFGYCCMLLGTLAQHTCGRTGLSDT